MPPHTEIHPWNRLVWENLVAKSESGRKAHAFLLCGPKGLGKSLLAEAYAYFVLVDNDQEQDSSAASDLFVAGTHPDLHVLMSEASVDDEADSLFAKFAARYMEVRGTRKPKQRHLRCSGAYAWAVIRINDCQARIASCNFT